MSSENNDVLSTDDIAEFLHFGKTKTLELLRSGQIPAMHIGKSYITTKTILLKWIEENIGETIYSE